MGAYRRRPTRAADGRPSKCPAAWGGVGRRGVPSLPLSGGEVKEKKPQTLTCILHEKLLRPLSAVRLVNNERPEALLCESSASNNRARRAGRSQHTTYFFGLRRAELACLRRFSFGLRRFSVGLRRQTNQAKEPSLRRLSTHLLAHAAWIGFASKWQQANPPVVVQQHASLLFRSCFLLVVTRTEL